MSKLDRFRKILKDNILYLPFVIIAIFTINNIGSITEADSSLLEPLPLIFRMEILLGILTMIVSITAFMLLISKISTALTKLKGAYRLTALIPVTLIGIWIYSRGFFDTWKSNNNWWGFIVGFLIISLGMWIVNKKKKVGKDGQRS